MLQRVERLLQLRVLCLGFFQDGDVGVGVFPEGEEILVSLASFGLVPQSCVGVSLAEAGERNHRIGGSPGMKIADALEIPERLLSLSRAQISGSAGVERQSINAGVRVGT